MATHAPLVGAMLLALPCALGATPQAPLPFASGLTGPIGIAVDSNGDLWVSESGSGQDDGRISFLDVDCAGATRYSAMTGLNSLLGAEGPVGVNHLSFDSNGDMLLAIGEPNDVVNGGTLNRIDFSSWSPSDAPLTSADFGASYDIATFATGAITPPAMGQPKSNVYNMAIGPSAPAALPWINELHYDNAGGDVNEMVEVAGPAGLDLAGYTLVAYNGSNGTSYKTESLDGVLPDQGGCRGALAVLLPRLPNRAPDGIALVAAGGAVLEFLNYEGSPFVATDGPAAGMTSTPIGVSETSSTPVGHSLQLGGSGSSASDFTWQDAQAETPGAPNTGQTFSGGCGGSSGDQYILDAGANAIIRRSAVDGSLSLFCELPPLDNPIYDPLDPSTGPPMSDAVPTGIVWNGQSFYVSLLGGYPFLPGMTKIVEVDTAGVVSDFATDMTLLTDIGIDSQGRVLVTSLANGAGAEGFSPFTGSVLRRESDGTWTTLADSMLFPTALGLQQDDTLFVCTLGDGNLWRVPDLPGTGEGYILETTHSSATPNEPATPKSVSAGETVTVSLSGCSGSGLESLVPVLAVEAFTDTPPLGISGLTGVHLSPNAFIVFNGFASGPLGQTVLGPGMSFSFLVPSGIEGTTARFQSLLFNPNAAFGGFTASDAHDIVVVAP